MICTIEAKFILDKTDKCFLLVLYNFVGWNGFDRHVEWMCFVPLHIFPPPKVFQLTCEYDASFAADFRSVLSILLRGKKNKRKTNTGSPKGSNSKCPCVTEMAAAKSQDGAAIKSQYGEPVPGDIPKTWSFKADNDMVVRDKIGRFLSRNGTACESETKVGRQLMGICQRDFT